VLEIDRACVLEDLLPLLRGVGISGDVPAAIEVGQFTVADDLQRLEPHHAVASAERVRGACHELAFRSGSLPLDPNRERGEGRHRQ
jgi:hypothetical protein